MDRSARLPRLARQESLAQSALGAITTLDFAALNEKRFNHRGHRKHRDRLAAIAAELPDVLDCGKTIASVVERNPGFDWDEGYEVAAEIVKLRRARGEKTAGRKIGFTNRNIRPEYGANALDHPCLALAFLADILARQQRFDPLAVGEVITTGTLTAAPRSPRRAPRGSGTARAAADRGGPLRA
ncbi:MAG: hypothetical protein K2Y16_03370 [Burkholderiales bacterium]|nr:hypothetical protein [Burkholderiales bacterium]